MKPERWNQVKELFHQALELDIGRRAVLLDEACGADEPLRREVELLISGHGRAGGFIETPPCATAADLLAEHRLAAGLVVGKYRIVSHLADGGAGEVYLGEDSALKRKVAIKFLRHESMRDELANKRLMREAQMAACLDHPNICAIHEVGEAEDRAFIVMQYVDGETLASRVDRKRLGLHEMLEVAIHVADALREAHSRGITHRDIKPGNIMITSRGQVKVLDFGLAKVASTREIEQSWAMTQSCLTDPGTVMGTVAYMSPEQAKGEAVDARTDVFSLGVVVYEMAAGRAPFQGNSSAEVLAAILHREPPPLARFEPETPAELQRIVSKALRKDRQKRYQTIDDFLIDLRNLRDELDFEARLQRSASPEPADGDLGTPPGGPAAMASEPEISGATVRARATSRDESTIGKIKVHRRTAMVAAVLASLAVIVGVRHIWPRLGSASPANALRNATFTQLTAQAGPAFFPSQSPDGKTFVYASLASGNWDIWSQRVGTRNPTNLTKDSPLADTMPAFSPDGEQIAFRSEREGGGIFVMGATGESVRRLTDFGFNPAWSPDGNEIACAQEDVSFFPMARGVNPSKLWAVNVATGDKRVVTEGDAVQPSWSPHGDRIAYWAVNGGQRDIWTVPAGGGEPTAVTNDAALDWNPVWAPDGKYLYFASDRGGSMNLWRAPIDERSGKVLGPLEPVTTPSSNSGNISISSDGRRIVYVHYSFTYNLQEIHFNPYTETVVGKPEWITQGSMPADFPDVSPDGEWIAFCDVTSKQEHIYVIRKDGSGLRQLTRDDTYKYRLPRWSPDGKRLAFYSNRTGKYEIWLINADGGGLQKLTDHSSGASFDHPIWSPDGKRIACAGGGGNWFIIDATRSWNDQSPRARIGPSDPHASSVAWSWSADGKKIAGHFGRPGNQSLGIWTCSVESNQCEKLTDFGNCPVWLNDNRRLMFMDGDKIFVVDSQSKRAREVWSVAPDSTGTFSLWKDNRAICMGIESSQGDIWMMTLQLQ
jgi:Tol biopolymer transport system component/tRNA A-37 threonylcarbamoyl transferase component Bud32